ncbi:uncharacterized protein [Oryctolagus cuniculus]|uniref:uncharacterized protein n=1 Tax=Oryctolagus cuniculus TaxID=9986 RepID=UPI00387A5564
MEEYIRAALPPVERECPVEDRPTDVPSKFSPDTFSEDSGPVTRTKISQKYMAVVNWHVENGTTSGKPWMQENSKSYLSFSSTKNARSQIRSALDNFTKVMGLTIMVLDCLVGVLALPDTANSRTHQILQMSGCHRACAGSVWAAWCPCQYGRRNTTWLFGPVTTRRSSIAEATARAAPCYGCAKWTNEIFPFRGCVEQMIIWWEEEKRTATVVDAVKATPRGGKVRADQICKSSAQVEPTPAVAVAVITGNADMGMGAVADGKATNSQHQQRLQDQRSTFERTRRLTPGFGERLPKREAKSFFRWVSDPMTDVTLEFFVGKTESKGRPAPSGDGKNRRPAEKPALAFEPHVPSASGRLGGG